MLYISSVQNAIFTLVASDPVLISSGFTVALNEDLNSDLGLVPWIGVYGPRIVSEPHTVNITEPWLHSFEVMVMIQHGDIAAPDGAEAALALAVERVWTVINSNRTLDGSVDLVNRITIEPYQRDVEEQGVLATDLLTIEAEARG